ncbi:MAG: hypothetical protein V1808_03155 [Candidatus Daviesbacteria bacterium]
MKLPDFRSFLSPALEGSEDKLWSKKNIITFLLVGIGLLVIPFGVKLAEQQTFLRIRAAGNEITFSGDTVKCDASGNNCTTSSEEVLVELRSPLGPPGESRIITLSGRVTDDEGDGLANVEINSSSIAGEKFCELGKSVKTDLLGNFKYEDVLIGKLFCIRGPSVSGYVGPDRGYEWQTAGMYKDPDASGDGGHRDLASDDSYNFVYTKAPSATIKVSSSTARQITASKNQPLVFVTTTQNMDSQTQELAMLVTKEKAGDPNTLPENCPSANITGGRSEWCRYINHSLGAFSWTTPDATGTYWAVVNIDVKGTFDPKKPKCSGNPWCQWPGESICRAGGSCDTTCGSANRGWADCGSEDSIKVTVN